MTKAAAEPKIPNVLDVSQYLGAWAIESKRGDALIQSLRAKDWQAHFAAASERIAAGEFDGQSRPYRIQDGVAVININGVMTKYGSSFSSDGSTIQIRRKVRSAMRDEAVSAIVLVIDSPGGTVAGTVDLVADVRKAAAAKPVFAFVEDLAASAAFWVASQATEVHANNGSALAGSIGTYTVVYDLSQAFEKEGIKTHLISTGPHKGAGTMGTEVTDEQLAHWQSIVDGMQKQFGGDVKAGRKLSDEQLEAVSSGKVWLAGEALRLKLIDAVSSFEEVVSRAASAAKKKGRTMSAEADSAPRGATLAELKTIGATSDFVVQQLEKGATLADAKNAWLDQRAAALDKREETIAAKEKDLEKREAAVKDAEAKGKTSGGIKVLRDPDASGEEAGGGSSAKEEFNSLVAAKVKAGMSRPKAVTAVVRENPDLHQRMLDEAPRVEIDRQKRA